VNASDRIAPGDRPPAKPEPAPGPPTSALGGPRCAEPAAASPWDQGPAAAPAVVLAEGEGLDLASVSHAVDVSLPSARREGLAHHSPRRLPEVEDWMRSARERFELGDFSGSLELVEQVLFVDPSDAEARAYLRRNEATLMSMYESKLGPMATRPRLAIQPEEVMWLNLDHRAGFLLAQIDGTVSYDDLFALSGVPRLDTARILVSLLEDGVITL